MDWDKAKLRSKKRSPEGRIFAFLRRLEILRQEHRVFDAQADTWIIPTGDPAVLGIGRYHEGEKRVALFNFSWEAKSVTVTELGDFRNLLTGRPVMKKTVKVPSKDFVWMFCDFTEGGAV
jgi:amylosucrase